MQVIDAVGGRVNRCDLLFRVFFLHCVMRSESAGRRHRVRANGNSVSDSDDTDNPASNSDPLEEQGENR